jgi:hypothetical protein
VFSIARMRHSMLFTSLLVLKMAVCSTVRALVVAWAFLAVARSLRVGGRAESTWPGAAVRELV